MALLPLIALYVHVVAAIIFVGGSLFIWLALMPGIKDVPEDVRNQVVVRVTKRFGRVVDISLIVLILTGIYNATWYLGDLGFNTLGAHILIVKAALVVVLVFTIYFNNLYLGRRISAAVREMRATQDEERREQLRARLASIRRTSHAFSYLNIALMLTVVLLAVMLQLPP